MTIIVILINDQKMSTRRCSVSMFPDPREDDNVPSERHWYSLTPAGLFQRPESRRKKIILASEDIKLCEPILPPAGTVQYSLSNPAAYLFVTVVQSRNVGILASFHPAQSNFTTVAHKKKKAWN